MPKDASHDADELEKAIQAKGLNAPRITPDIIRDTIVGKTFTKLPSGKKVVCELTLRNGFTVTGEASVVDLRNFNQEIAEKVSFENAMRQIWPIEGYLLQQKLYEERTKPFSV